MIQKANYLNLSNLICDKLNHWKVQMNSVSRGDIVCLVLMNFNTQLVDGARWPSWVVRYPRGSALSYRESHKCRSFANRFPPFCRPLLDRDLNTRKVTYSTIWSILRCLINIIYTLYMSLIYQRFFSFTKVIPFHNIGYILVLLYQSNWFQLWVILRKRFDSVLEENRTSNVLKLRSNMKAKVILYSMCTTDCKATNLSVTYELFPVIIHIKILDINIFFFIWDIKQNVFKVKNPMLIFILIIVQKYNN